MTGTAVMLVQLGGPERREELRPFLYELFADPEVLRIPVAPVRKLVAWLISTTRERKSAAIYEAIGWSPIRRLTEGQRARLEAELGRRAVARGELGIPVVAAMVCSEPTVERALLRVRELGRRQVLVLPLYPQYSFTTTRSAETKVREEVKRLGLHLAVDVVGAWYELPGFLDAHADRIRQATAALPDPEPSRVHVLYSAHSLPKSLVERHGDPYRDHVEATVALVNERLGGAYPWSLAYQSKVGYMEWLGPSTIEEIARLGRERTRQVIVVPIAFVTEHVETLYEIAMLFAAEARKAGIEHFRPVPALDDHPRLVEALADLVEARVAGGRAA